MHHTHDRQYQAPPRTGLFSFVCLLCPASRYIALCLLPDCPCPTPVEPGETHAASSTSKHAQVANADVLVPTTGPVDAQAIRSAKRLKLIVQPATGYSNIDVKTAAELGIPVCNSPGAALS